MLMKLIARFVAMVGATMIMMRRWNRSELAQAAGASPDIPQAVPQRIPTLKMPTARGWREGEAPVAAPGLKVNLFAGGLKHPRQIYILPNGDVLAAESLSLAGPVATAFDIAIVATMRRAAALGDSPNRITLLRDADGDGVAEKRSDFLTGLNQPFGMTLIGGTLYVGNVDGIVAFDYRDGDERITQESKRLSEYKSWGHWTRNLLATPDGRKIFVAVGSLSNIGEGGMAAEEGRACIYEFDVATGKQRIFASGLRNPVGLAFEPKTGALWTVVNERDGIGDETPPDYLTSVREGGFYGWPYSYWGRTVDHRVPQKPELVAKAITPDYALGGHTASLGLCHVPEGTLPGFGEGMAIGQHGSWNRSTLSGYKLIFVPFAGGKPSGPARDLLTGFLAADEKFSYGRPVGVAVGPDRKSLLLADDVGNVIWRVSGA